MTNPLVHTLVFVAAVLIPGGLLVYFAWRAASKAISTKRGPNQNSDSEGLECIPDEAASPDEALEAFIKMYPKYTKESLRARNRVNRLNLHKTRPRKKSH